MGEVIWEISGNMSDELSNSAKLAILKYLVGIFLGGFTVFSTVVYFAFIKPLENLKPSIVNSVNENVKQILDKVDVKAENLLVRNEERFYKINNEVLDIRSDIQSKSKEIDETIKEAKQKMKKLNNFLAESTQIQNNIKRNREEIKNIVQGARTDVATQAGLNLTSMLAEIEKLSKEIKLVSSKVEGAHGKKVVRSVVPVDAKPENVKGPTKLDEPNKLLPCEPLDLTEQQIESIFIEQRVERTETISSNNKRYYRNIFSVAIRQDDGATVPKTVRECILNAIDRVDYLLAEYWFKPARRPGSDRDANFRFSIRVWGVTSVIAEVHLKGDKPTLKKRGWFSVSVSDPDSPVTVFESENGGATTSQ